MISPVKQVEHAERLERYEKWKKCLFLLFLLLIEISDQKKSFFYSFPFFDKSKVAAFFFIYLFLIFL